MEPKNLKMVGNVLAVTFQAENFVLNVVLKSPFKMMLGYVNLVENKTMIMISHDMSFSKIADRIMFFENGELSEIGSHMELMDKNHKYAPFFKCQAESFNEKREE